MDSMKKVAKALAPYLDPTRQAQFTSDPSSGSERVYKCATCHDLEWLYPIGIDGQPVYNVAVPCKCLLAKQKRMSESPQYMYQQGVRHEIQTFENFRVDLKGGNREAHTAVRAWVDPKADFIWLLIYGGVGNGKSHLCNAAALESLRRGVKAKLITASGLLSALRMGMSDHTTDAVMAEYQNMPCLIIDDLGAGMKHPNEKGSEWEWARIEELLVSRYENLMPTMACTNLDIADLPERIASRFNDKACSRIVHNAAGDYRGSR